MLVVKFANASTVESSAQEFEKESVAWLQGSVYAGPYAVLTMVLLCDLRRCQQELPAGRRKPTQRLYEAYFGIDGQLYSFKVAALQLMTVLLQAFGKLRLLGSIVSLSVVQQARTAGSLRGCF